MSDDMQLRAWEMRRALVYGQARAERDFSTIPAQEGAHRMASELLETFDYWFPSAKTYSPSRERARERADGVGTDNDGREDSAP